MTEATRGRSTAAVLCVIVAAIVVTTVLWAGRAGDDTSLDACGLVPPRLARQLLGSSFDAEPFEPAGAEADDTGCTLRSGDARMTVFAVPDGRRLFDDAAPMAEAIRASEGFQAWHLTGPRPVVTVLVGRSYVQVVLEGGRPFDPPAVARELAASVAGA